VKEGQEDEVMREGQAVEVHTRFDDSWSEGFEIAEVTSDGFRVRRLSDGSVLPGLTSASDVRPCPPRSGPALPAEPAGERRFR
jgi:hypothetical protein